MEQLLAQYGIGGLFILVALILGIINNKRYSHIIERLDNLELDQIQQAVYLVQSGALEQEQLVSMIKNKRDQGRDTESVLNKALEGFL